MLSITVGFGMDKHLEDFLERYPFFALIRYGETEYVCIIQNQDSDVTTIYDYRSLKTEEHRIDFITLAEQWWWESNRMIPINIFLKDDWSQFRYAVKTLLSKEVSLVAGHTVRLADLAAKRTKRKMVQLVRKPT
jgi:hypothetical protein